MTDELIKNFFDTFGIEPKKEYYCPNCETKLEKWETPKGMQYICGNDSECDYFLESYDEEFKEVLNNLDFRLAYPQITDTHYLKLICILHTTNIVQLCTTNIEDLKEEILMTACYWVDKLDIKHQVRTLFEEG